MDNEELKKKIIDVLRDNIEYEVNTYPDDNYTEVVVKYEALADALVAAGIGDVSKWETLCKVLHEQMMENMREERHRAEVAERALLIACVNLIKDEEDNVNMELLARVVYTNYLRKAEKELAEE